jgi:hypothetical protein
MHRAKRIGQQRMPVAHADIDRKWMAGRGKTRSKTGRLPLGDRGDRRHATEEFVVVRHFLHALGAHATPAQHVGQKRADVVGSLRSAEGNDQNRIEHVT